MKKVFETQPVAGTPMDLECRVCGKQYTGSDLTVGGITIPAPTLCSTECSQEYDRKAAADKRGISWRAIMSKQCPALLNTDRGHTAMPPRPIQDQILSWEIGPKGMLLIGPTGTCKTRMLFLLLRRLWVGDGVRVKWFLPGQLGKAMQASHNRGEYEEFTEQMSNMEVLAIDDLGKEKITDSWGKLIFDIINARMLRERPTLITTNYTGDSWVNRFDDKELAAPLVRRIRESSACITLKEKYD